jgi:hypothetical protein
MHRLRPSVLLRRSDRILTLALLSAAQALFLWMFFAADPLERHGAAEPVLRFAADWRHGMASNSWLYMPGFFATAAAVWLLSLQINRRTTLVRDVWLCGALAIAIAAAAAPIGTRLVRHDLAATTGIILPAALPFVSPVGALQGLYTLATWTAFVVACRVALADRRWQPFALPAALSIGLALVRPWTVDDFTGLWIARLARGDAIAVLSLVSVGAIAAVLAIAAQRSQSRSRPTCHADTRRAETTISR